MKHLAISVLAFVLALGAIALINVAGTALIQTAAPAGLSADGVPVTPLAEALLLTVAFVAGAVGAALLVLLAPGKPVAHALVYLGVIVVLDAGAAVAWWSLVPTWFSVAMVATAPLQVWAGAAVGLRLRRTWRGAVRPAAAGRWGA